MNQDFNVSFTYNDVEYDAKVVVTEYFKQQPDSNADNSDDFYGYTILEFYTETIWWQQEDGSVCCEQMICEVCDAVYQCWNNDSDRDAVNKIISEIVLQEMEG